MDKIFDSSVIDIEPISDGLVIAYRKEEEEDSGKIAVAYKLYNIESEETSNVTRNVYLLSKFGPSYKQIESKLPNPFYWKTVHLPNGKLLAFYPDGKAALFDIEAKMLWNGAFKYESEGACDVAFSGANFWALYENAKCVIRSNPINMKTDLRIGGKISKFGEPTSLYVEDKYIYVCDKAKNLIWRIDGETFNVTKYIQFDEPVLQYLKVNGYPLVWLKSGIYKL